MGFTYTEEQQKVIDTAGKDILVSAAAGSGKTAVLVARIMRMIIDENHPVDIDRLLIVTFTKAAADEMRERISRAIQKELLLKPENEQLQKQATYIHKAQITTIDSFCKYLIANHFDDIGVDPALRVADEAETKLLMQDVMAELMEEKHAQGEPEFIRCLECFATGKNEKVFEEMILKIYQFAMSYPWPEEWLDDCLKVYQCENFEALCQMPFVRELLQQVDGQVKEAVHLYKEGLSVCEESDGPYMYAELLEKELAQIEGLERAANYEEYQGAFSSLDFGRLPTKKDDTVDPAKREYVKNLRSEVKEQLTSIKEKYFGISLEQIFADVKGCLENATVFVNLTKEFMRCFSEKKAEKKIMDFQDMEHMALAILYRDEDGRKVPSDTAKMYRDYFEEIMIDEYQDSNLVQELLLMSMARDEEGKKNSFMVGDVKQSIYKFRLARPEIFMEKYNRFTKEGEQIRIDLHKNFRSRMEVVETVNVIFEQLMDTSLGGIAYDDAAKLYLGADYPENPDCKSELLLYEKDNEEAPGELAGKDGEAEMIALRIQNLVGTMQVTDKENGELRPARYGDIVILLRSLGSYGPIIRKALENRGIPVYIPVSTGYFMAIEIRQVLDYLRILNNPYHDVELCGVLKSPFFSFTDEELAIIKGSMPKEYQRKHFYPVMKTFAGMILEIEGSAGKTTRNISGEVADEAGNKAANKASNGTVGENDSILPEISNEDFPKASSENVSAICSDGEKNIENHNDDVADAGKKMICETQIEAEVLGKLQMKVSEALKRIEDNRKKAIYLSVYELILELMRQSNYMEYESAMPAGQKRRANLEMLLQKAIDFEKTSYHGLFDFVRYMEQLEKYEVDFGEAGTVDENMDAVRIMTIHKSKGLEFPICFVSGLSKRYNMQSAQDALLFDTDLGIAMDYINSETRVKAGNIYKSFLAEKTKKDGIAEELRVLYVALTRAKEKLIMTGYVSTMEKALKPCQGLRGDEILPLFMRSGASNHLSLILAAFSNRGLLDDICQVVHEQDLEQVAFLQETKREYRKEELLCEMEKSGGLLYDRLKERFQYEYPHKSLSRLYTKTSVSELKKAAMEESEEVHVLFETDDRSIAYLPKYMRKEEEPGGVNTGSAYHKVLELLDYEKYLTVDRNTLAESVALDMEGFRQNGLLSEEYQGLVRPERIAAFLKSNCAKRMGEAAKEGKLFKERPFVMQIPANRLGEEFPDEEGVLIQGIIDVYFKEGDGIVVLDYKTDRVQTGEELVKRYQTQLDYYADALEKLTGMKVTEKIIYSFALKEEIAL